MSDGELLVSMQCWLILSYMTKDTRTISFIALIGAINAAVILTLRFLGLA